MISQNSSLSDCCVMLKQKTHMRQNNVSRITMHSGDNNFEYKCPTIVDNRPLVQRLS